MLEPQIPFFATPNTEYIVVGLLFGIMMYLYFRVKDYFVIICTALIGSFLMMLGISYSGVIEFDFLFNLEIGKFKNLDSLVS